MNGKAAKRIRIAARVISRPDTFKGTVKRLKCEYYIKPYHTRKTPVVEGHSAVLRRVSGHKR